MLFISPSVCNNCPDSTKVSAMFPCHVGFNAKTQEFAEFGRGRCSKIYVQFHRMPQTVCGGNGCLRPSSAYHRLSTQKSMNPHFIHRHRHPRRRGHHYQDHHHHGGGRRFLVFLDVLKMSKF